MGLTDLHQNKQKFIDDAKAKIPSFDEELVSHAWNFAKDAHSEQKRDTGETYFSHPVSVAYNLLDVRCDSVTIAAALLHDVVEDVRVSLKEIQSEFGPDVAYLVDGVTKLAPLDTPPSKMWTKDDYRRESLSKLFVAIVNDPRVALVKLADRLHNLTTLGALSEERKSRIARESLDVFVPIAESLGLGVFQSRIQDLAFRYLEPEKYQYVQQMLKEKEEEFKVIREIAVELIEDNLAKAKVEALVYGRQKEVYSTYRKMQSMNLDFDRIYDIIGIRVIVNTEEDCYRAKHVVDQLGSEVKYDDYIIVPRGPLGYQSLHKVVLDKPGGALIEIQIRSKEMHERCERGAAAHWIYKLGGATPSSAFVKKINMLREKLGILGEEKDLSSEELMDGLAPQIHVFSPHGDVLSLREGSTPIDFAYHIHTELGHECCGARINGKIVPLEYELRDGDTVDIIRRRGSTPNLAWIREGKVKSKEAQQKIRQYFQALKRQEMLDYGQNFVQKHLKLLEDLPVELQDLVETFAQIKLLSSPKDEEGLYLAIADGRITIERLNRAIGEIIVKHQLAKAGIAKEFVRYLVRWCANANMISANRDEILFLAVAEGVISLKILNRAIQELEKLAPNLLDLEASPQPSQNHTVSQRLLFHTAQCCYPVPGDTIIGFVTVGEGLSLHRTICPQVLATGRQKRLLPTSWQDLEVASGTLFSGQVIVTLTEANTITFREIQHAISKEKGVIREQATIGSSRRPARISLTLDVGDVKQLQSILNRLRQIKDVIEVKRIVDDDKS